jgi:aryl-alcohol dehydrogenase (NADP+)
VTPWSPLARGFIAGNRKLESDGRKGGETLRARTDDYAHKLYYAGSDFEVARRVGELAARRGSTAARVALAWLLRQPGVVAPIVGATRPEQLDDLIGALDLTLDDAESRFLEEPYVPHPVLGHH